MQSAKFIFSVVLIALTVPAGISARADEVTLKNKYWTVGFDKDSGALVRLESHSTDWNIESRPKLGISFRLNAPTDHHDNFMYGRNQKAAEVTKVSSAAGPPSMERPREPGIAARCPSRSRPPSH